MGFWINIETDLKVDPLFGDFEIRGNDIAVNRSNKSILKDTIIERFKTSFNDFILNPNYGANLNRFLGRGISKPLADELVTSFRYSLTYDNYVSNDELDIIPVILDNSIQIYVYIIIDNKEELIQQVFYNSEGLSFDK